MLRTALLVVAVVAGPPCFAHHGVAPHYDATKPVHLEGVVAKFDFINPHSFLYIDVVDAAGNVRPGAARWRRAACCRATV